MRKRHEDVTYLGRDEAGSRRRGGRWRGVEQYSKGDSCARRRRSGPGHPPRLAPPGYSRGSGSGSIQETPVEEINLYRMRPTGKIFPMSLTG